MVRTFERSLEALDDLFAFADEALVGVGASRVEPHEVKLVLEELFTNCVRHNKAGRQGVHIELTSSEHELRIVVTDHGVERFDITQVAPVDPDAPLQSRREGGMGIHLVRKFCDDLRYDYEDGTSRITATFKTRSEDVRGQHRQ
jgi:anti-sigma regulatory factor (Ser/Thr protein kinase)